VSYSAHVPAYLAGLSADLSAYVSNCLSDDLSLLAAASCIRIRVVLAYISSTALAADGLGLCIVPAGICSAALAADGLGFCIIFAGICSATLAAESPELRAFFAGICSVVLSADGLRISIVLAGISSAALAADGLRLHGCLAHVGDLVFYEFQGVCVASFSDKVLRFRIILHVSEVVRAVLRAQRRD